jgi:hypothetical protein
MSTPYHGNTHDGVPRNNTVSENLNFLCQLELILSLIAIFPLLDSVHTLIKFAQSCDVFMCDFINVVKICQLEFYQLYNDSHNQFDDLTFDE